MAKILSQPKSGSVGPSTFQNTPHGLVERQRAQPLNPKTTRQQTHRSNVAAVSSQWGHLAEAQRAGWMALAAQLRGNLSGQQLFVKANVVLVECGLPQLAAAPAVPVFGPLSCTGLLVEDRPTVQLLQVLAPAGAEKLLIDACEPVGAGVYYVKNLFRRLTVVNAPLGPAADLDLTAAYVARFGAPEAGLRVVMRITAMKDGFKGVPLQVGSLVVGIGA